MRSLSTTAAAAMVAETTPTQSLRSSRNDYSDDWDDIEASLGADLPTLDALAGRLVA